MKRRVIILGGGESGTGAALLGKKKGCNIFLSDSNVIKSPYKEMLLKNTISFEEGGHSKSLLEGADIVIKSPGIPDTSAIVLAAKRDNIPVISEIEFASGYTNAFTVCVTGSNGKTTTTHMIYHMMKKAGLNAGLAGNVGNSWARMVAENDFDYYALELSSFQLDGIDKFKPDIALILNITPDHLDRYDNRIENYADSKFKIINSHDNNTSFIWCSDDLITRQGVEKRKISASQYTFSFSEKPLKGAYVDINSKIHFNTDNNTFEMTIDELALKGRHNGYNSMAAGIAGQLLRIRKEIIRECLSDFQGIEHRLEYVLRVRGIDFINDSKATNVNSTWYALESMRSDVIWIAGGVDKGNDYEILKDLAEKKVRAIVCMGLDNSKIKSAFQDSVSTIIETNSMEEAVKSAYYLAKNGESVLLSPACASFDLFDNYEDRGRKFKHCVRNL